MSKEISLNFTLPLTDVDREGRAYHLEASEEECNALAERFDLAGFSALKADVQVKDKGPDVGIEVSGQLEAALTQRCIVTLDPVTETVKSDFTLMLVSPEMADRMDEEEVYLDPAAPEYDALEGDIIPLGDIVAQTVSINMNPYPRVEGAEISIENKKDISVNEPELKKPNPFAVLEKLRKES
ncbi:YceD family protein [Kordiimonas aestuarii]|uniref:YceD family protein n=1 Tax=Kordiimonas aestuarii TaxID=1005925 RepID=UPI0021CF375E|nr:DUF177 domain-containing protein [Kordiimonas aestuarii]